MQDGAKVVTYVQGRALHCARVDRELGSFRKADEVSKVFRAAEQLLKVLVTLFSVGRWPGRPCGPLEKPAPHTWAVYQMVGRFILSAGT